jgi:8-amino-7-oxononanoate synthase
VTLADRYAEEELATLKTRGLLRALEPLESGQGPVVSVGGRRLVSFSSNDYLSLAGHRDLAEAARSALSRYGVGAGASRLIVGHSLIHAQLEERMARFERTEAALVFNSGYCANVGVLGTLVGEGDVILSDALNHASIVDGCRLSRAKTLVYRHADLDDLRDRLDEARGARRRLIATDSVFSMEGDTAPLEGIADLARRYEAMLFVDEAHATGVFGERGAGLCEALGVASSVDLRMGTLGKALGSFGATVAGSRAVIAWLTNAARSLVFTTALPPAVCAAAIAAIDLVEREPERRVRLWQGVKRFAEGLSALGVSAQARSPIFPVVLGEPQVAIEAARALGERGLLVKAIRPPTVPAGTSRLRFALCAGHTPDQIDAALSALGDVLPRT